MSATEKALRDIRGIVKVNYPRAFDILSIIDIALQEAKLEAEVNADYREVFGRNPEPWRGPLGALRLTLMGDDPWALERARDECEELVRVLNGVKK